MDVNLDAFFAFRNIWLNVNLDVFVCLWKYLVECYLDAFLLREYLVECYLDVFCLCFKCLKFLHKRKKNCPNDCPNI